MHYTTKQNLTRIFFLIAFQYKQNKMIYAKIINNPEEAPGYHVVLYFYGQPNICRAMQKRLEIESISPLSFLAINNFEPVTDTLFVKRVDKNISKE